MEIIRNSLGYQCLQKLYSIYLHSGLVQFFELLFSSIRYSFINTKLLTPLDSKRFETAINSSFIFKYVMHPVGNLFHEVFKKSLTWFNHSIVIKAIKYLLIAVHKSIRDSIVYKVLVDENFRTTYQDNIQSKEQVSFYKILLYILAFTCTIIDFKYVTAICLLLFVLFLIEFVGKKKHFRFEKLDGAILIYFVCLSFGTFASITPYFSTKLLLYNMVCLFVYFMISRGFSKKEIKALILIFLLGSMLAALLGVYQQIVGVKGENFWIDEKTNPGLSSRIFSFFGNPNVYGEYLIVMISLGIAAFLSSSNWLRKLGVLAMTFVNLVMLLLTYSRGAWIGVVVAGLVFLVCYKPKWIPFCMLLGFGLLFVIPQTMLDRLLSIFLLKGDTSTNYRVLIWQGCAMMLKDYWDVGVGLGYGAFMKVYNGYQLGNIFATHSHNTFLQVFLELGIGGLLAFLYLVIKTVTLGLKKVSIKTDKHAKLIIIGAIGAIAGLLTHGLVEYVFFDMRITFLFWVMLSLVASVNVDAELSTESELNN